jgi:hypothetical protein
VSSASLAIEDPFVILHPAWIHGEYDVDVRFLLKETGGNSGANIEEIFLRGPRGGESIGGPCTRGLRVPPGGVLDTFYTDESVKTLSYCSLYLGSIWGPNLDRPVEVSVTFRDDEGRRGRADAKATVK